jgi:23S rRNA (uracil1939-C5)-methyltransferase
VRRAFAGVDLTDLDPFIHMDQMGEVEYAPGEPKGTPWHPHRGFETVTYMLDGHMQHKDNHGNTGDLGPGDVQWMSAARGIIHSEMPQKTEGRMRGFPLWLSLPAKEKMLLDNLQRIGQVSPAKWIPALCGPQWGYRRRARLGVMDVTRRGRVLVGFRERNGPHVTDMRACHTLVPDVGQRLEALSELVASLSIRRRLPQIEVAAGDNATALVLRHLSPLASRDLDRLRQFESETGLWIHLQPKGPDTVRPLSEAAPPLWYELPKHGVRIHFLPTDFIQVNAEVNAGMVDLALEWLDPRPGESVLDLFSGLGNFGLPIARRGARVTAVEGERGLVRRGEENARENGLAEEMSWHATNLFEDTIGMSWAQTSHDKVLLDPPRSGAREVIPRLAPMGVRRIVYVSCHPATLARDAAQLVHEEGYRLEAAGAMDMFPHTAHVEAIAVFERSRVET